MGFIQKLATRSKRVKGEVKANTVSCNCEYKYKRSIPKLTWKYILTLKNWR